jgi:large subunit ribosomal protein L30
MASQAAAKSFFRITLIRPRIGLPSKATGVLKALGLRKRMATVFHLVTPSTAGQIMQIKELVAVSEVDKRLTKEEVQHQRRVPEKGWYVKTPADATAA